MENAIVLMVLSLVPLIISEVLPYVKSIRANGILQLVGNVATALLSVFKPKPKLTEKKK